MFKLIPLQISFGTWRRKQWHCKDRQWQWRKKKILSALRASQLFPWFDQPWFTPDFCPHECCLNAWGYENFKGFKLRTSHHERIFFSHIIELCRISLSTSKGFRFPHHPWTSLPHSNFCTWQRGLRTSLDRQRGGWETWRWARKTHPCSCRGEQRIQRNESPPPSGRGKPERLTLTRDWTLVVWFLSPLMGLAGHLDCCLHVSLAQTRSKNLLLEHVSFQKLSVSACQGTTLSSASVGFAFCEACTHPSGFTISMCWSRSLHAARACPIENPKGWWC